MSQSPNEKQVRMMHIVNLMSIAYSDGNISETENDILVKIAQDLDLTEEDFDLCIDYWKKTDEENIPIAVPESDEEQIEFLKHFAIVMMIDGQIEEKEKTFLAFVADQFGYDAEKIVPALIEDVYHEYFAEEDEEDEDPLFEDTDDEFQTDLGKMELEGKNVEKAFDYLFLPALRNPEALNYFLMIPNTDTRLHLLSPEQVEKVEEAAGKGYPLALYTLGRYYQVIKPTDDWIDKASDMLSAAAEHGIADARWALAMLYLWGYTGPVDISHYTELIDNAFDNGSMMAFRQKLSDRVNGLHGEKADPKGVIKTIESFLDNDDTYGMMYPDLYAILGDAYRKVGNKDNADKNYEKALEHGFLEAGARRFTNRIEGPDKDFYRETLSVILDYSCEDNDPNSFVTRALEHAYHHDKEDCKDPDDLAQKLREDLETAYRLGAGDAAYYMGLYHYEGKYGYEKDDQKAWSWFARGQEMESGLAFMGMAQMIDDGIHPSDLPDSYRDYCILQAQLRGVDSQSASGSGEIPAVVIVKPDGAATIYKLEKEEWHKLPHLIGSKRLAPIRIDALDKLGEEAGFSDHLVAWIDIDAPRKGLPENRIASAFYPGIIAGDIVFSLADNLYDPMPFYGVDEAKNAIKALKATFERVVTDISDVSDEKAPTIDYSKVNPFSDRGYVARVEPDGKAYIIESSPAVFALFEEDIYDPARLHSLYKIGNKAGINQHLTIWTDNDAYRKQMALYGKVKLNAIGSKLFPGPVVDNFFIALEDEDFRINTFDDLELLKKACLSLGIKPENIIL